MQTFVTDICFNNCAIALDRQRLGKQRVESLQILNALTGISKGWRNHPATRMWENNIPALGVYSLIVCKEWVARGYQDSCYDKIVDVLSRGGFNADSVVNCTENTFVVKNSTIDFATKFEIDLPDWWGGPIHESHRKSLLFRKPDWYSQFKWDCQPSDEELYWPVALMEKVNA